jgi:hypothetical protein
VPQHQPSITINNTVGLPKDTGPGRVERGSSRWVVGVAIVAAGAVLVLSTFLPWGDITSSGYEISMSGLGQVSVQAPAGEEGTSAFIASQLQDQVGAAVHNPGIWALVVGLITVLAGAAFLRTRWRSQTALTVAVVGGIEFLVCMGNAVNVAAMMGSPALNQGEYGIGFGLLLACAVTLALVGLGVTAFVLERIYRPRRW